MGWLGVVGGGDYGGVFNVRVRGRCSGVLFCALIDGEGVVKF